MNQAWTGCCPSRLSLGYVWNKINKIRLRARTLGLGYETCHPQRAEDDWPLDCPLLSLQTPRKQQRIHQVCLWTSLPAVNTISPPRSRLERKTRCWTWSHTEPRQFRLAVNKWSTSIMNITVCTRPPPVAAEHPLLQFQTFCMLTTLSSAELKTTIRVYVSPVMWCIYFNQRADGLQEKRRQSNWEFSLVDSKESVWTV